MKKRILIFCTVLTAFGLTAFGLVNWNDSETSLSHNLVTNKPIAKTENKKTPPKFLYDVGTRFRAITKEKFDNARSIHDFFYAEELQGMVSLNSVNITVVKNENPSAIHELGYRKEFNEAQLKLLQTLDYSSNFSIRADFKKVNAISGMLENEYANPYITIVPEKQAVYVKGKEALIAYLRANSKAAIADVNEKKLGPAKLYFTVTKHGSIANVRIDNHSGYPEVDKKMMELITNMPGEWESAENSKGEKVDEDLIFSYGLMGC